MTDLVLAVRIIADFFIIMGSILIAFVLMGYSRYSGDFIYRRVSLLLAMFVLIRGLNPVVDIVTLFQGNDLRTSLMLLASSSVSLACAGAFARFLPEAWEIAKTRMVTDDRLTRLELEIKMWRRHFDTVSKLDGTDGN